VKNGAGAVCAVFERVPRRFRAGGFARPLTAAPRSADAARAALFVGDAGVAGRGLRSAGAPVMCSPAAVSSAAALAGLSFGRIMILYGSFT
jgi:hypothetical protein